MTCEKEFGDGFRLMELGRQGKRWVSVGWIIVSFLLLAGCGGVAATPTSEATPTATTTITPTPEAMVKPTPTPTYEAMVMEKPTPTPTHEAMVMEKPTPTPTHEAMVMEKLTPTPTYEAMVMGKLTPAPTHEAMVMVKPTPIPGVTADKPIPTPTTAATGELTAVQEVAVIENYAGGGFFPDPDTRFSPARIVVLKGIPVKLYLTRLHREHINAFTILPWVTSTPRILPGEVGVIEFTPDQTGTFKIHNVGHNFEGCLIVVENTVEAKEKIAETGTQELALIHSIDDSRIFPDRTVVQKDIPVKIYNISLTTEHRVSIKPFYDPKDINVRPLTITLIEFTPDRTGEFTIRAEISGLTGTLVVEDN